MTVLVSALIGFVSGIASGAFGIGGALLTTPGIRVLLDAPALIAVGTTLPVIIPTAITGVIAYHRQGFVDVRLGAITAVGGSVFAVLGAYVTRFIRGEVLMVVTAAVILVLAIRMLPTKAGLQPPRIRPSVPLYLAVGAASGFLAGLLGIGGGVVLVPVFTVVLRLPLKTALGTSLAVVAAQAVPGSVVHAWLGHINWAMAAGLALGVIPGARLGAKLALGAQDRVLRVVVALGMAALAIAFGTEELRALVK